MNMINGFLLVLIAGVFQGAFILPMGWQKGWRWENGWFAFSLLGMLLLNWLLAFLLIPGVEGVYAHIPFSELAILALFGLCWGCGSVLFGIGMDRLGMSLGYPVIMGLLALLGAVIPLLMTDPAAVWSPKGGLLLFGSVIVIVGIVVCTRAHKLKTGADGGAPARSAGALLIAVAAGALSCFPNIGASFGVSVTAAAQAAGASAQMAGNAVWALLFSFGLIPNVAYTLYLLIRNRSFVCFADRPLPNLAAGAVMSLLWIGSFYLYGAGASKMGGWGLIVGWPLFISLSIVVGNLLGLLRGEWDGVPSIARRRLFAGMSLIIAAMVVIGLCNLF